MDRQRRKKTRPDKERDKSRYEQVASPEADVNRPCLPTDPLGLLGGEERVPNYLGSPDGKGWVLHPSSSWEKESIFRSQETWVPHLTLTLSL